MLLFNGNAETKRRLLLSAREAGNRVARGEDRRAIFWSRRSWCQAPYVCNKQGCDHSFYASEVGVPLTLAYAEHALFNELSEGHASKWPERFLNTLSTAVDGEALHQAWRDFALFVLNDDAQGLISVARTPEQRDTILRIVELFESNSSDENAWKEAGRFARQVSHSGPDTNRRLESEPALVAAGAKACYAAAHFAYTAENPRYAAEAVSWAAWAFRYRKYGELMRNVRERDVPADSRGMVNVGVALFAFGDWMREADICERQGEIVRNRMYTVYADAFIGSIKREVSRNTPGFMSGAANLIATLRQRLSRRGRSFGTYRSAAG